MEIVRASEDQCDAVRDFYFSLIDAMAENGTVRYVGWQKDVYPTSEMLFDAVKRQELYLGMADGEIAAAMIYNHEYNEGYKTFDWGNDFADSEVMVIHLLGVHPDHSRRGYAREMVEKAIDVARESGMKALRLDVLEGNVLAEKLYEGIGFKYLGDVEMFYEDVGWQNFKLYEYVL